MRQIELDDPYWEWLLKEKIIAYIPAVRNWWKELDKHQFVETCINAIDIEPAGLFYRFCRLAKRSPIKGIQAFTFIDPGYLQLTGIAGGSTKLLTRLCTLDVPFTIEEFTVLYKNNVRTMLNQGPFLAIIPTDMLHDSLSRMPTWLYVTQEDMIAIIDGSVTVDLQQRALRAL